MPAKKEKPGYDIEYLRRATIDADYNYIELNVKFDPSKIDGKTVVQDTEKMVVFARELTASEARPQYYPPIEKSPKKKAAKKPAPVKEVGKTEDIKIADLKAGDKVNISVRLVKAGEPKAFVNKADGSAGLLCKCDVEDKDGTKMKLTLFGDQVARAQDVKPNAWLTIQNGYVKEYQGALELSVGQWGTLEVVYNG